MELFSNQIEKTDIFDDKSGYWVYLKGLSYPDIIMKNESGDICAELVQRNSAIKIWWNRGPQYYVIVYAHTLNKTNFKTDKYFIKLEWSDINSYPIKTATINQSVDCGYESERTVWTFSTTETEADIIKKSSADLFGSPITWERC